MWQKSFAFAEAIGRRERDGFCDPTRKKNSFQLGCLQIQLSKNKMQCSSPGQLCDESSFFSLTHCSEADCQSCSIHLTSTDSMHQKIKIKPVDVMTLKKKKTKNKPQMLVAELVMRTFLQLKRQATTTSINLYVQTPSF